MDNEGRLSILNQYTKRREIFASTYKPRCPACVTDIVAEDIISPFPQRAATICPGQDENHVESEAQGSSAFLLPSIPITGVNLLGEPKQKIGRVNVGFDSLQQRSPAYQTWRHQSVVRCLQTDLPLPSCIVKLMDLKRRVPCDVQRLERDRASH